MSAAALLAEYGLFGASGVFSVKAPVSPNCREPHPLRLARNAAPETHGRRRGHLSADNIGMKERPAVVDAAIDVALGREVTMPPTPPETTRRTCCGP